MTWSHVTFNQTCFYYDILRTSLNLRLDWSSLNLERWMVRFVIKDGNSNLNIPVRWGQADMVLADARSDCSPAFLASRWWLWLQPGKIIPHPAINIHLQSPLFFFPSRRYFDRKSRRLCTNRRKKPSNSAQYMLLVSLRLLNINLSFNQNCDLF